MNPGMFRRPFVVSDGAIVLGCALGIAACVDLPSQTPLGGVEDWTRSTVPAADKRPAVDKHAKSGSLSEDEAEPKAKKPRVAKAEQNDDELDAGKAELAREGDATTPELPFPEWEGRYEGNDVATTRFGDNPEKVERDPNAVLRVDDDAGYKIVIVDSNTGYDICSMSATPDGAVLKIDDNAECFSSGPTVGSVVSGTARRQGEEIVFDMEIVIRVETPESSLEGSLDYHFQGESS